MTTAMTATTIFCVFLFIIIHVPLYFESFAFPLCSLQYFMKGQPSHFGERDVHLTVENVGYPAKNNALFTQDAFVQFVLDLPEELGALIDTGHAMANHWDIPELIKTLGKRIRGYHLHNTDGIHDLHRPIFEQNLWYDRSKMENLLETAAEYSPDADLILEYAPGEHITPELLHGDVKHIQNIWR